MGSLGCALDSYGSGQGSVASSYQQGNAPSGSIKCWEFLEWLLASQEKLSSMGLIG
jgi:hypothetical protein